MGLSTIAADSVKGRLHGPIQSRNDIVETLTGHKALPYCITAVRPCVDLKRIELYALSRHTPLGRVNFPMRSPVTGLSVTRRRCLASAAPLLNSHPQAGACFNAVIRIKITLYFLTTLSAPPPRICASSRRCLCFID
jgi:hypothetical protein